MDGDGVGGGGNFFFFKGGVGGFFFFFMGEGVTGLGGKLTPRH